LHPESLCLVSDPQQRIVLTLSDKLSHFAISTCRIDLHLAVSAAGTAGSLTFQEGIMAALGASVCDDKGVMARPEYLYD
jgi:hypothetical protein